MTTPWPLISEEEIDSTSRLAHELLDQGKEAPFAIVARRQTAGRGRRGTQWESPEGGLYLTIACPKIAVAGEVAGTIPLKAGLLFARFLKRRFGFTPTLKWPNDLVFAGCKLGGMLCEVSVTGADRGPVLVGIGLNVRTTPKIEGDYPAISLKDITGAELDPAELAREVVDAFAKGWEGLSLEEVPRAFEAESLAGPGHLLFSRSEKRLVAFRRIDEDGSLVAAPLEGGPEIRLTSIENDYTWIYLGKHRKIHPVAVADVGNSAVKLAVFEPASALEPKVVRVLAKSEVTPEALGEFRQAARLQRGWPVFALAVDRVTAGQLGLAMDRAGLVLKPLTKTPLLRKGERYSLADLGADRLAALEGWLARRPGRGLAVVVSAGTATTIDAVTDDGMHWGGLILPGLQTGLNALASHTDLLPTLDAREVAMPSGGIGNDTRSAMGQGVRMMTLGAVKAFAAAVATLAGRPLDEIHYVATGGFAPLIAQELKAELRPTLILEGIRAMALGGMMGDA